MSILTLMNYEYQKKKSNKKENTAYPYQSNCFSLEKTIINSTAFTTISHKCFS